MRKKTWIAMTLVLSICCLLVSGNRTAAVNYDSKIKKAQEEKKEYNRRSQELQKEIEELEKDKSDAMAYIEKLDKKVSNLEEELETLNTEISSANKQLEAARAELSEAEDTEERQYNTMKRRIKYMYENGSQDYLEILLSSGSISELLNRTEYIEKISAYDKNIFNEYQQTKERVEEKKKEIENRLTELRGMKEEAAAEKSALKELKGNKKEEIQRYNDKLETSQDMAEEFAKQVAKAEAEVERLLEAKQDEIDRQNAQGSGNSGGGDGTLRWPLNVEGRISSGFGPRTSPTAGASTYHRGIDIAVAYGTPIVAAGDGTVVTASYSSSEGNYVMISHGDRLYTVYMHCSRLAVSAGTTVSRGQVIAYVGSTGISTGAHLHFGVSKNGTYVDPLSYVSR
ncbi:MAG: DUF3450 family protein [Lachnospiraceae bacterium]|nr:DUF3450 family protein [Lachnospiraceae bacterium]